MADKPSDRRHLIDPESFWDDTTEKPDSDGKKSPSQTPRRPLSQGKPPQVQQPPVQQPPVQQPPVQQPPTAQKPRLPQRHERNTAGPKDRQQPRKVVESTEYFSIAKVIVSVVLVAAVSAFLGWILIGRPMADSMLRQEQLDQELHSDRPDTSTNKKAQETKEIDPELVVPIPGSRTAVLSVKSTPPNAIVFLDDERFGVTPTQIRDLDPMGRYRLRIELDGHKSWEQDIVYAGTDLNREIVAGLIAQGGCSLGTGYLYVMTKPRGATIEIDGKRLPGKTPQVVNDVCARIPLSVRLRAKGHHTWHKKIEIQVGEIKNLNVILKPT